MSVIGVSIAVYRPNGGAPDLSNIGIRDGQTAVIASIARSCRTRPLAAWKRDLLVLLGHGLLLIRVFLIHIGWWAARLC